MIGVPSYDRLIHQVDIVLVDTEHADATGSLDSPESTVASGVNCLIIAGEGARVMGPGHDLQRSRVRVMFLDPLAIHQGHVLIQALANGQPRRLVVDSFLDDQEMGRIWVADCTVFADPVAEELPPPG